MKSLTLLVLVSTSCASVQPPQFEPYYEDVGGNMVPAVVDFCREIPTEPCKVDDCRIFVPQDASYINICK